MADPRGKKKEERNPKVLDLAGFVSLFLPYLSRRYLLGFSRRIAL
jgi:hypothetical protein